MTTHLRKAIATEAKPLIGLYAESGCGKTWSSLLLAKGFAGDMAQVAMIETEAGRGEAYADDPVVGGYMVRSIKNNFSPEEYGKAISDCEEAKVRVMIVDSASHEWEGANGVLSMAADNEEKGWKGQIVWTKPKMEHTRNFMLRLSQTSIPLVIICMRAKYPLVETKNEQGKKDMKRATVPSPKQSEDILYEMFAHGWIDQNHVFHGTKYTRAAFRDILQDNKPITEESGKLLAQWAAGGRSQGPENPPSPSAAPSGSPAYVTADQAIELEDLCREKGIGEAFKKRAEIQRFSQLLVADYENAKKWIAKQAKP